MRRLVYWVAKAVFYLGLRIEKAAWPAQPARAWSGPPRCSREPAGTFWLIWWRACIKTGVAIQCWALSVMRRTGQIVS